MSNSIEMTVSDKEGNTLLEREIKVSVKLLEGKFMCVITDDAGFTVTLPYPQCVDKISEITNDYYEYLIREAEALNE